MLSFSWVDAASVCRFNCMVVFNWPYEITVDEVFPFFLMQEMKRQCDEKRFKNLLSLSLSIYIYIYSCARAHTLTPAHTHLHPYIYVYACLFLFWYVIYREVYEYMITRQREKGRSRSGKGESFSMQQVQTARDEYDEEATLFVFRLKSLKQGQSRSLLTQAARHHAAQVFSLVYVIFFINIKCNHSSCCMIVSFLLVNSCASSRRQSRLLRQ
jgi:hypothetical protein